MSIFYSGSGQGGLTVERGGAGRWKMGHLHSWTWKWKLLSHVRLFATPLTVHGILQARILEWVVYPFSRGSSGPRNWTSVSCIIGGFFTNWAIREALFILLHRANLKEKVWSSYLIKNLEVKGFALKISCIWGKTSLSEKKKKTPNKQEVCS